MKKDTNAIEQEKVPFKELWKAAPSLKPGRSMIEMAAQGNEYACAIRDAWKFKHSVVMMNRNEYSDLVECCTVTFHG